MPGNNLGTASGAIVIDTGGLKNADIALRSAGTGLLNFGEMLVGAFAAIVGAAADYQKNMDTIKAISGATADEIDRLSQLGIDMAKNSIFGPLELAKAFTELTKAGATVPDLVNGVAAAAVALASATGESIVFAGENLLGIMNTFKLGADQAMAASDILAGAANASAIDLNDLVISMKYAGPVASALGISLLDTATAITELGKVNIKGSTAGTALRAILLNLTPASKKAEEAMKALGIITEDGKNAFYDANGQAKSLSEIFQTLQDKTKGLTDQAKVEALRDIFGVRAVPAALELMKQGAAGFADLQAQVQQTTAQDVAAERTDNLAGSIDKLKATVQALMVEAGGPFQTMLQGWVDGLTNLLKKFDDLPEPIKKFIVGFIGALGVLSIFAGVFLLTIGNIIRMIRVMGELRNAFAVIRALMSGVVSSIFEFGGAFLAAIGPIGWIILAIAAIIAIAVILYNKFTWFHDFIDNLWQSIQRVWDSVLNFFRDLWGNMQGIWDHITGAFGAAERAWTRFTDLFQVSTITNAFGAIADWAGGIAGSLDDAWNAVKDWVGNIAGTMVGGIEGVIGDVVGFFEDLPGNIGDALSSALDSVRRFGGRLLSILGNAAKDAVGAFIDFVSDLPYRFGYILGVWVALPIRAAIEIYRIFSTLGVDIIKWVIGFGVDFIKEFVSITAQVIAKVVEWHIDMLKWFAQIAIDALKAFFDFMVGLPGQLWDIFTTVMSKVIDFHVWLLQKFWEIATTVVSTLINVLVALPGEIWNIFTNIVSTIAGFIVTLASTALNVGKTIVTGIINEAMKLPGQIWDILTGMVGKLIDIVPTILGKGVDIGASLLNGIKDGLGDIAGWLWDMLKKAVDGIGSLAGMIYDAGSHFIGGFLSGVWDSLFGSPHTKVEYVFWDMEDNVMASVDNMYKQVRRLDGMTAGTWGTSANMNVLAAYQTNGASSTVPASVGAGEGYTIVGPLLNVETLTGTQEEALSISRRLSDLTIQQLAAQGKRATLNGVS
jgi:TP901 family phage tail tape measure protein